MKPQKRSLPWLSRQKGHQHPPQSPYRSSTTQHYVNISFCGSDWNTTIETTTFAEVVVNLHFIYLRLLWLNRWTFNWTLFVLNELWPNANQSRKWCCCFYRMSSLFLWTFRKEVNGLVWAEFVNIIIRLRNDFVGLPHPSCTQRGIHEIWRWRGRRLS